MFHCGSMKKILEDLSLLRSDFAGETGVASRMLLPWAIGKGDLRSLTTCAAKGHFTFITTRVRSSCSGVSRHQSRTP